MDNPEKPMLENQSAEWPPSNEAYLRFKRSKFSTRLPESRLYVPSHFWLSQSTGNHWRIGFTKFATRMLGEPVEFDFEVKSGSQVEEGQVIGWIEGFKAVTDLYAPMSGEFLGVNSGLDTDLSKIKRDPYGEGWFYSIQGAPGDLVLNAVGYAALLGETIDRMLGDEASDSLPIDDDDDSSDA